MGGGLQQGPTVPPSQTPQLQNSHHKVMLTRESMPKLNSSIIPWFHYDVLQYQFNSKLVFVLLNKS